jgi:6-pyruvoyltetrahydropterin/6-carboxytetrahydropterin synthase
MHITEVETTMVKTKVTKSIELDYGHTLPAHYDFCSQIHGHRAKVQATVKGVINTTQGNSSQGMVLDFKILKDIMTVRVHNVLDHGFAVWKQDEKDRDFILSRNRKFLLTEDPPTAEYLARWAYESIKQDLPDNLELIMVRWYETPNSWADYPTE